MNASRTVDTDSGLCRPMLRNFPSCICSSPLLQRCVGSPARAGAPGHFLSLPSARSSTPLRLGTSSIKCGCHEEWGKVTGEARNSQPGTRGAPTVLVILSVKKDSEPQLVLLQSGVSWRKCEIFTPKEFGVFFGDAPSHTPQRFPTLSPVTAASDLDSAIHRAG